MSGEETEGNQKDKYKSIVGSEVVETTKAKTRLAFIREDLFPNMPLVGWKEAIKGIGNKIEEYLGFMSAPSRVNGELVENKKRFSISLPHYGRADFIPMVFASIDGTVFFWLVPARGGGHKEN